MADPTKQQLLQLLEQLSATQLKSVLDFTRYLAETEGVAVEGQPPRDPLAIPRPEEESVIDAIRRLKSTYPMIDAQKMLPGAADLMTQHVMQGREAQQVIDDLEALFRDAYDKR